jgi:hypothetical protein
MSKNIFIDQNNESNQILLAAQRSLYSNAKTYRNLRTLFSVILAIFGPILFYYWANCRSTIMLIGVAWIIISEIFLKRLEFESIKNAATVQEQFDVELFDLPWNEVLTDNKVTLEVIQAANRKFDGNRNDLKNWYADTSLFPYPLNVMLCQRSNIVWDWRLRQGYGFFIFCCASLIFAGGVIFGLCLDFGLFNYLTGIFLTQFAAIHLGFEVSRNQILIANEKKQKEQKVNTLVERGLKDPNSISPLICRQIQDFIYTARVTGPLVPDFFYNLHKREYEFDMNSVVETYRKWLK